MWSKVTHADNGPRECITFVMHLRRIRTECINTRTKLNNVTTTNDTNGTNGGGQNGGTNTNDGGGTNNGGGGNNDAPLDEE